MSHPRIGRNASTLAVEPRRRRQTPRPRNTFQQLLEGGANALLTGARAASAIVGLPSLSAAVTPSPAASQGGGQRIGEQPEPSLRQMMDQRMSEEIELLALQSQIQRHNRQITLVSNVMKARHDTAKAAIGNLRS